MVSDAKKKKAAAKKVNVLKNIVKNETAANKVAEEAENISSNGQVDGNGVPLDKQLEEMVLSERTCTGILTSHPQSRDIQFENFSLLFHGHELISDTNLELNYGRSVKSSAPMSSTVSPNLADQHTINAVGDMAFWVPMGVESLVFSKPWANERLIYLTTLTLTS